MKDHLLSTTYPYLAEYLQQVQRIDKTLIHPLLQILESQFGDLLDLNCLESEAAAHPDQLHHFEPSTYFQLFRAVTHIGRKLSGQHITEHWEITKCLLEALAEQQKQIVKGDSILNNLILKIRYNAEHEAEAHPKQPDSLSKLAMGTLKKEERLSPLDMQRAAAHLTRICTDRTDLNVDHCYTNQLARSGLPVLTLDQLFAIRELALTVAIINLQTNPKEPPRWGVYHAATAEQPNFYTEFPLYPDEQAALTQLGRNLEFRGATAGEASSSGYAALAYLDSEVLNTHKSSKHADAWLRRFEIWRHFFPNGGSTNSQVKVTNHELHYCDPTFPPLLTLHNYGNNTFSQLLSDYLIATSFLDSDTQPKLRDFETNNLVSVMHAIIDHEITSQELSLLRREGFRNAIVGLDTTLSRLNFIKDQTHTSTTLCIPNPLDLQAIYDMHKRSCRETHFNSALLGFCARRKGKGLHGHRARKQFSDLNANDVAATFVMTFFRTQAKKPIINLDIAKEYSLTPGEQATIRTLVQDNPYITEIRMNRRIHRTFHQMGKTLRPFLSRNKWLHHNDYKPSPNGQFWREAARYWVKYLYSFNRSDLANETEAALFDEFRQCIQGMGIQGLGALLAYCTEQKEMLQMMFETRQVEFFVDCIPDENTAYLTTLASYIEAGNYPESPEYFPFSKVNIHYQATAEGIDNAYILLLNALNRNEQVERITLDDLMQDQDAGSTFLRKLIQDENTRSWSKLIIVPELEDETNLKDEHQELHDLYAQLNNLILRNRREKAGALLEESHAGVLTRAIVREMPAKTTAPTPTDITEDSRTWPLAKDFNIQLQLQQEQELEVTQEQEVQQQRQQDAPLESGLIDYSNIDAFLDRFLRDKDEEGLSACAPLKKASETQARGFFRTWVSGNPEANAPHMIQKMTRDAVKQLFHHRHRMTQGVDLHNLPKGFYCQRDGRGALILCYDAERSYADHRTSFTLDLDQHPLPGEKWRGDYRQFYPQDGEPDPDSEMAISARLLFEICQPTADYSEEITAFLAHHREVFRNSARLTVSAKERLEAHWLILLQMWRVQGNDGIHAFFALRDDDLRFDNIPEDPFKLLLGEAAYEKHQALMDHFNTPENFRAIGQVYYRYGNNGVAKLIADFQNIYDGLGPDFFEHFKTKFIDPSENLLDLMTQQAHDGMNAMIEYLRGNPQKKALWLTCLERHFENNSAESFVSLWEAFYKFNQNLDYQGLSLSSEEVDRCTLYSLPVFLGRLHHSLDKLNDRQQKATFLNTLSDYEHNHGDVHYAIAYDGYKRLDEKLVLRDFRHPDPAYAPDPGSLFTWATNTLPIKVPRCLSTIDSLTQSEFEALRDVSLDDEETGRLLLALLLTTQRGTRSIAQIIEHVQEYKNDAFFKETIRHMHTAVYQRGIDCQVTTEAVFALMSALDSHPVPKQEVTRTVLPRYPDATFLEMASLLTQAYGPDWDGVEVASVVKLFTEFTQSHNNHPVKLNAIKYIGLLISQKIHGSAQTREVINKLRTIVESLNHINLTSAPAVQLFFKQLLTIEFDARTRERLSEDEVIERIRQIVDIMNERYEEATTIRERFIETLIQDGIRFRLSASGRYRNLREEDFGDSLRSLAPFHEEIKTLFMQHVMLPNAGEEGAEQLNTCLGFLQRFLHTAVDVNELAHITKALQAATEGKLEGYWSIGYLLSLLKVLDVRNPKISYPISLLHVLLSHPLTGLKPSNALQDALPKQVTDFIKKELLERSKLPRETNALFLNILLTDFAESEQTTLFLTIYDALKNYDPKQRQFILALLAECSDRAQLVSVWDQLVGLVNLAAPTTCPRDQWKACKRLWLELISKDQTGYPYKTTFETMFEEMGEDQGRLSLILHSLARAIERNAQPEKRLDDLIAALKNCTTPELETISTLSADIIHPTCDTLFRIIQAAKHPERSLELDGVIQSWTLNPYPAPRHDYAILPASREADLNRMLLAMKFEGNTQQSRLNPEQLLQLLSAFNYLKDIESGKARCPGSGKTIHTLSREEMRDLLQTLNQSPEHRVWRQALLFEGLHRTTGMYPHMAQQLATLGNVLLIHEKQNRALRISTGEGKSNLIALRAADLALAGKKVDISTAKRTLAKRDELEFQTFYQFFGLRSTYVHQDSQYDTYENAQIAYSTMGDFSLLFDRVQWEGTIIHPGDRDDCVLLSDEIDATRFEENANTQYNFAAPFGRSPKEMMWFYDTLLTFYNENKDALESVNRITMHTIGTLMQRLEARAQENEQYQELINEFSSAPDHLARWIQAAYIACRITINKEFVCKPSQIRLGDEVYELKEIIPLSRDNQLMRGSSFSEGVQQLVAVRQNLEARAEGKPETVYVPAQSQILSTQTAAERIHTLWPQFAGFTGTVSAPQAKIMGMDHGAIVLAMPTNLPDRREWATPQVFETETEKEEAVIAEVRNYLNRNESILFACKDDAEVNELKQLLENHFSPTDIQTHFLFVTNEGDLDSETALLEKRQMENWQHGIRGQGVGLLSSAMGRGDNPGVAAVFLTYLPDNNDAIQKGGRTARNGAAGTVHQFLTFQEVFDECKRQSSIETNYRAGNGERVTDQKSEEMLATELRANLKAEPKTTLIRIAEKREALRDLVTKDIQRYHSLLANYCAWGLPIIARLDAHCDDPGVENKMRTLWAHQLAALQTQWLQLAREGLVGEARVRRFREQLDEAARSFNDQLIENQLEISSEFTLRAVAGDLNSAENIPFKPLAPGERIIWLKLSRFKRENEPNYSQLMANCLQAFEAENYDYQRLAVVTAQTTSLAEFTKCATQIGNPNLLTQLNTAPQLLDSEGQVLLDQAKNEKIRAILQQVRQENYRLFDKIMQALGKLPASEALQNSLAQLLIVATNHEEIESRLTQYTPLINYLGKTTMPTHRAEAWALDYITQAERLEAESSEGIYQTRCNLPVMPLDTFERIYAIATRFAQDEDQICELLQNLGDAVANDAGRATLLLARWEFIVQTVPDETDQRALIKYFAKTLSNARPKDWENIERLYRLTHEYWNKDNILGTGIYKDQLMDIWQFIAEFSTKEHLYRDIVDILDQCENDLDAGLQKIRNELECYAHKYEHDDGDALYNLLLAVENPEERNYLLDSLQKVPVFFEVLIDPENNPVEEGQALLLHWINHPHQAYLFNTINEMSKSTDTRPELSWEHLLSLLNVAHRDIANVSYICALLSTKQLNHLVYDDPFIFNQIVTIIASYPKLGRPEFAASLMAKFELSRNKTLLWDQNECQRLLPCLVTLLEQTDTPTQDTELVLSIPLVLKNAFPNRTANQYHELLSRCLEAVVNQETKNAVEVVCRVLENKILNPILIQHPEHFSLLLQLIAHYKGNDRQAFAERLFSKFDPTQSSASLWNLAESQIMLTALERLCAQDHAQELHFALVSDIPSILKFAFLGGTERQHLTLLQACLELPRQAGPQGLQTLGIVYEVLERTNLNTVLASSPDLFPRLLKHLDNYQKGNKRQYAEALFAKFASDTQENDGQTYLWTPTEAECMLEALATLCAHEGIEEHYIAQVLEIPALLKQAFPHASIEERQVFLETCIDKTKSEYSWDRKIIDVVCRVLQNKTLNPALTTYLLSKALGLISACEDENKNAFAERLFTKFAETNDSENDRWDTKECEIIFSILEADDEEDNSPLSSTKYLQVIEIATQLKAGFFATRDPSELEHYHQFLINWLSVLTTKDSVTGLNTLLQHQVCQHNPQILHVLIEHFYKDAHHPAAQGYEADPYEQLSDDAGAAGAEPSNTEDTLSETSLISVTRHCRTFDLTVYRAYLEALATGTEHALTHVLDHLGTLDPQTLNALDQYRYFDYLVEHLDSLCNLPLQTVTDDFVKNTQFGNRNPKPWLDRVFDFTEGNHQEAHRMALVHLLKSEALITEKAQVEDDEVEESGNYSASSTSSGSDSVTTVVVTSQSSPPTVSRWTTEDNNRLLDECLSRYAAHNEAVLESTTPTTLSAKSQLSPTQHRALLGHVDELHQIFTAGDKPLQTRVSQERKIALEGALAVTCGRYQKTWFKSSARKRQFKALKSDLAKLIHPSITHNDEIRQSICLYEQLLVFLHAQKLAAMNSDKEQNKKTWTSFTKQNKKGHSRFQNTLNIMIEQVLQAWAQDPSALAEIHNYESRLITSTLQIAHQLNAQVKEWQSAPQDLPNITTSQSSLEATITQDLPAYTERLRAVRRLPGHIKTLVNEVDARLERLNALQKNRGTELQRITTATTTTTTVSARM